MAQTLGLKAYFRLGIQAKMHIHWGVSAWVIALLVLLPILAVFGLALWPQDENIWPHLWETVLGHYISTTLMLMLGVGLLSACIGVSTAWLTSLYEFPGRRIFEWALLLPFAMPAYVIAYVYTDLLEYAGSVQTYLRTVFAWQSPHDYWFPPIRSLGGAIAMLTLVLYPYVFMLARAAFLEQSPSLRDASRLLGCSAWGSFWRISLPIARPAIAVGLALVLMETLNDFGTVDYFAVRTLTAGLYDVWLNMGNLSGAAQIAVVMLVFVLTLMGLENFARRKQKMFSRQDGFRASARIPLQGSKAMWASLLCTLPLTLGFLIPFALLARHAWVYFDVSWTPTFFSHAWNSFYLSSLAAILALVLGVLLAYGKRLVPHPALQVGVRCAGLGYAMPGAVLAVGVMIPFSRFDHALDAWMQASFGISTGLVLSGTLVTLIFAYLVRFLAVAIGSLDSSLAKVTPSMDMAARSLGCQPKEVLWRVHLPLIRPGLLTAGLVVFVDCMKELPATLILRPFGFDTLATHVYQYASDELLEESALAALVIVLVGILPVILISRAIVGQRRT
ncbi:iron(III) transport system permease protein [Allopseudospirillum japonicum]|uniref:Iron(III) transport system permease protein n=1 Tax=Allopseudospirillum japonicum TaxID=64971 RepID=A0A1H6T5T6_9GAMM|nr:iron ABC transporter permease [Allopseudospirillum japonicum]SEI71620.1 iron(III) transport system permease protein [Allopseudospirillum japonicum]